MPAKAAAVRALEDVGLTQYEAECFVALTRVPQGTAKDVSQLSEVPRSRVYDAVERLQRKGLVDVQQSDPREFRAVAVEEALELLRDDYGDRLQAAADRLSELSSTTAREDRGVWAVADHDHVASRMRSLVADASAAVTLLIADDRVLDADTLAALADATDRGVTVRVAAPTPAVAERVRRSLPGAVVGVRPSLAETERIGEKWPGQLLAIDDDAALASGVEPTDLPDVALETAVWSTGLDHGFATWVHELLPDRVDAS
ncbi:MAG: TrmB family transcriptional regulator [Haloarculaceae archaeon]